MDRLDDLNIRFHSLVIFRSLLEDDALKLLPAVIHRSEKGILEKVSGYSKFVSKLFKDSENITDYIWNRIITDENICVKKCAIGKPAGPILQQCLMRELKLLEEIAQLKSNDVIQAIGYEGDLPPWDNRPSDFIKEYQYRIAHLSTLGFGMFAAHTMFSVTNGSVTPVKTPDKVRLSDLVNYERERKAVSENTLALLNGKPAANVLLYGDAGTGKSSTVKAIVNEYAHTGLRLIEIRKNQLKEIPSIIESIYENPLKFILFIDDLSFSKNEEIGELKAILEGTVAAKAKNVAIYATSNRRHLINETFSDRGDDEIHREETIQEQISLSDRFGLAIRFFRPDKEKYLSIVYALARQYDLKNTEELDIMAERHAIERGGRSPRTARQFIEYLKSLEDR